MESYGDFSALNSLAHADLVTDSTVKGNKVTVTLKNVSEVVAFFIDLKIKDAEGEIIVPGFWSDNLVSVAPGQEITLTWSNGKDIPEGSALEISGWNIEDCRFNL